MCSYSIICNELFVFNDNFMIKFLPKMTDDTRIYFNLFFSLIKQFKFEEAIIECKKYKIYFPEIVFNNLVVIYHINPGNHSLNITEIDSIAEPIFYSQEPTVIGKILFAFVRVDKDPLGLYIVTVSVRFVQCCTGVEFHILIRVIY